MELLNITSVLREQSEFDLARLARECLKNLSGEDLRQLFIEHDGVMAEFEGQYTEVQGSSLENELAKIMSRYAKEGKPQPKPVSQVVPDVAVVNQSQGYFSSAKKSVVSQPPQISEIKGNESKLGNSPAANGPSAILEESVNQTPLRMTQQQQDPNIIPESQKKSVRFESEAAA